MDALEIERAHLVGNSMGGRVALEIGLRGPSACARSPRCVPPSRSSSATSTRSCGCCAPSSGSCRTSCAAGSSSASCGRCSATPTRWTRASPTSSSTSSSASTAAPARASPSSPGARNIYLDSPFGRGGFYPRLAELEPPALFVWGTHDQLIPAGFNRHVGEWLPGAEQVVLDGCGHVPQVERPEQTAGMLRRLFARADALAAATPRRVTDAA